MENLEFKISTGLKNIIGKELITNDNIAIFELVKNAYDADAYSVVIIFQDVKNAAPESGKILVFDDGHGMSYQDIKEKWLWVGFSEKKIVDSSDFRDKLTAKKRAFAGAKGIGRFSTDRLGRKLTMYTKTKKDNIIHHLAIDWRKFEEDQKQEFRTIDVSYSKIKSLPEIPHLPRQFERGTILEIAELNSAWDRDKLLKLKRYLQRLVNPAEDPDKQEFTICLVADEFAGNERGKEDYDRINGPIRNVVFEKLDLKTTQLRCKVRGDKIITELIDKGRMVFRLEETNEYDLLNDINIIVFYLSENAKTAFTRIMGLEPKNYGSIFLYKSGFRIHPYGNEDDDWLGLDRRKGQGFKRYFGNREVLGRIEVNAGQSGFVEVTSRDRGVVESAALQQLTDEHDGLFMVKVLRRLERYVREAINWDPVDEEKQRTPDQIKAASIRLINNIVGHATEPRIEFNKDLLTIFKEKEVEKIPELIRNVQHISNYVSAPAEKKYIESQLKAIRVTTERLKKETKEKEEALAVKEREALFLAGELSSDVRTLHNLIHAIGIATDVVKGKLDEIDESIKSGKELESVLPLLEEIRLENRKAKLLAELSLKANFDTRENMLDDDIIFYIKQYVERVLNERTSRLRLKIQGDNNKFKMKFRITDISLLLDNFISNSKKAGASRITIAFEIVDKSLHILIADNGGGVPDKYGKELFKRGFSTTGGSGIGLNHVRTIVESMGGSVSFVGNNVKGLGAGACFEVILE